MKKLLFSALLLLMALAAYGQQPSDPPAERVDSLSQFRYMYRGQPFPFESGVSISEPQYIYLLKMSLYGQIENRTDDALKPVPRIVYQKQEVRKKGDGNKLIWGGGGTLLGLIVGILITR